jgi:DNA replication and repair protein RecF
MAKENIREKSIKLNGVPMKGTNGLFDAFKAVVFTPDDIELIKGNPEKRRSFVDLCFCQLNTGGIDIVRRYDLLINHRNSLLKSISLGQQPKELLNVWDRQVAAVGSALSVKRNDYIKKLAVTCNRLYSMITDGKEELSIEYNSNIYGINPEISSENDEAFMKYFRKLEKNTDDEIRLGYTMSGAHRDDLTIKINGLNVREFGSQGQKKTAALVMKLSQAEIYYKNKSEAPVILLDDVMGELDENRQKLVFDIIKNMQVFITTCNENSVRELADGAVFRVENGRVTRQR